MNADLWIPLCLIVLCLAGILGGIKGSATLFRFLVTASRYMVLALFVCLIGVHIIAKLHLEPFRPAAFWIVMLLAGMCIGMLLGAISGLFRKSVRSDAGRIIFTTLMIVPLEILLMLCSRIFQ